MIGWVTNVNECKLAWNWDEEEGGRRGRKQSLFRPAERTAEAAWLRSSWRPLSIILIIESSRGCFKTSNLSDVSRSRVTIPHSLHSAHESPLYESPLITLISPHYTSLSLISPRISAVNTTPMFKMKYHLLLWKHSEINLKSADKNS